MLRKEVYLAAFAGLMLGTAAPAQNLVAPADPVATIEGEWTGIRSQSRIRVTNGTVTLVRLDPRDAHHGFTEGMVIGRLKDGGERINNGRSYSFSSSQCLVHYTRNGLSSHKMEPCGQRGASLQTFKNSYHLYVSGMGFEIPRKGSATSASSTKLERVKPAPSANAPEAKDSAKPASGEFIQSAEKKAKYEAELAEYQRTIAEQQEAERRKRAAHAANQREAERAKAEFDEKMKAHRAELAASNARQQEYFAAQRRHALCVGGDQQACADIAAGKPAIGQKLAIAEPGKASTDSDARTCVTPPVIGRSTVWNKATAATVVNGCRTAVDVRLCLLRSGGWNCGVNWGLKPQEKWTWTSFEATGEVFWDARVAGSGTPLDSPGGS